MFGFIILIVAGFFPYSFESDICNLPVKSGRCEALIPRYYFNNETNKCEKFNFGGCDGNDNNFIKEDDCKSCCVDSAHKCTCTLPPKSGPCLALFTRYYFDTVEGKCKNFTYGGCDPNANNFLSMDLCRNTCEMQFVLIN